MTETPFAVLMAAVAAAPESIHPFLLLRRIDALKPDRPRLGEAANPRSDAVRIGQQPGQRFAPRSIAALEQAEEGPARLQLYGFGLFGPAGPLPAHLTEYAFARQHQAADPTLARFVDIFHHRMACLLFRAWAESEPVVSHDRPAEDRFGMQLGALVGFGMPALRGRDRMPDFAKLHFTGRLAPRARNPEGLEAILSALLGAAVRVVEFVPQRVAVPESSRAALGHTRIGSAMIGTGVVAHDLRIRLVIGPLDLLSYEALLPGGDRTAMVADTIRNYLGDALEAEINPVLRREEVPRARLGRAGRLGWTGWLGRRTASGDAADLLYASRRSAVSDKAPHESRSYP